jgi:hypothetical protein
MASIESVKTWSDLVKIVASHATDQFIFRGVRDASYQLIPAIGRNGARKDLSTGKNLPFDQTEEEKMLRRFQREAQPYLAVKPAETTSDPYHISRDYDLHAVAQHHGLNTRLLDWSESPLVAAFFAVEKAGLKEDGKKVEAAIYGVPCPRAIVSNSRWPDGEPVAAFFPPHLTPRITVQRGLFTIHDKPDQPWQPAALRKWLIPSDSCINLKVALSRAGINRASLFPDLDGIAAHINWLHKRGLIHS